MKRPCSCEQETCSLCNLFYTSQKHWRNWGGQGSFPPSRPDPETKPTPPGEASWVDLYSHVGRIDPPSFPALKIKPRKSTAVVTLVAGDHGRRMAATTRPILAKYANRIGADFHAVEIDAPYPLGGKFRVRDYLAFYDRLLFLDIDIVLSPTCPSLFDVVPVGSVGIHDDGPYTAQTGWVQAEWDELATSQGLPKVEATACLNTGVVVCDREHKDVWSPPTKPYQVRHCSEQHWVNINILRSGFRVKNLKRIYNWQWWIDRDGKHTDGVQVWHYAGASQMLSPAEREGQLVRKAGELYPGLLKTPSAGTSRRCGCGSRNDMRRALGANKQKN